MVVVDLAQERAILESAILEKRLQVRGFPKIWTDELTFDEISWFLFDLLSQFGPINNVAVSQSKKDSVVYGIVDMQREEDMKEFVRIKLDENCKMRLDAWNTTLSFRQFSTDPDCPRGGGAGKPEERPASRQQSAQPPANKDNVLKITQPLITSPTSEQAGDSPKKSESDSKVAAMDQPKRKFEHVYSRDEIMALQEKAQAQQCKLDPEFDAILRGAENIPTTRHHSGNNRGGAGFRNPNNNNHSNKAFGQQQLQPYNPQQQQGHGWENHPPVSMGLGQQNIPPPLFLNSVFGPRVREPLVYTRGGGGNNGTNKRGGHNQF